MNKLKNIGISALAGTLISLSAAQAGGVSVTGSWELSYTKLDNDETTGNPIGMNKNIAFGASGDVSDGGSVTWATTIAGSDAMGLSSASMNINMGGIATLAYDSGTGGYGANAVDNIVPTAWEEIDAGFSTGITDVGAVSKSKGVVNLTIKAPGSGTAISVSYVPNMGGAHIADGGTSGEVSGGKGIDGYIDVVNVALPQFGLRLGVGGEIEFKDETCQSRLGDQNDDKAGTHTCTATYDDHPYAGTGYASLRLGPVSAGFQRTYKDPGVTAEAGIANNETWVAGVALNFGDYVSVSYGQGTDTYRYNNAARLGNGEEEQSHFQGYSAAVNAGPAALKFFQNEVDHLNGSLTGDKHSEINLSIAF